MSDECEKNELIALPIPFYYNGGFAITCYRLIKKSGFRFTTDRQKKFILGRSKGGIRETEISDEITKVLEQIIPTDKAVVYCSYKRTPQGNRYIDYFILDEEGVRLQLRAHWGWKKTNSYGKPFSKDRYRDTALRRREQTAGEGGPDMVYKYTGCQIWRQRPAKEV